MRRPVTVQFSSTFEASADEVWTLMRRLDTFLYLVRGLIGVPGANRRLAETAEAGKADSAWLLLFHVLPLHRHTIEVVDADATTRTIRTHEHGGLIRRWDHTLHAEALPDGRCRYRDTVVIDAGAFTPLVVAFAKLAYPYRHRRWPRLLARNRQAAMRATRPSTPNSTDAVPPPTQ